MSADEPTEPSLGEILSRALASAEDASPQSPLLGAADGDVDDLRSMVAASYNLAVERRGASCIAALGEALSFARLAAVNGTPEDMRVIVFLYGQIAAECRRAGDVGAADRYEGQGFLLAEMLAEDGNEEMADMVVLAAPAVSPGAHREAKRLREELAS